MANNQQPYDVGYGLASVSITSGVTIVATTGCSYHGITVVASATRSTVYVYDSISAASGNLVDLIVVSTTAGILADKFIPVYAKHGIVASVTGTGLKGSIFFGPKG
jgi:hypothetical protein